MYDLNPNSLVHAGVGVSGSSLVVVGQSYVSTLRRSRPVRQFQGLLRIKYHTVTAVLVPGSGVEAISPGDRG